MNRTFLMTSSYFFRTISYFFSPKKVRQKVRSYYPAAGQCKTFLLTRGLKDAKSPRVTSKRCTLQAPIFSGRCADTESVRYSPYRGSKNRFSGFTKNQVVSSKIWISHAGCGENVCVYRVDSVSQLA